MTATARVQQRQFQMHPRLLLDVIQRQAGTLGKSIAEGVMNSVDAGATFCNVSLDNRTLVIEDDGGGFPTEDYIAKFFETFGQPPEEDERKTYGYFRIGRGQLFAAGRNMWESGDFRMHVDIKEHGNSWDLEHDAATGIAGCRITVELYEPLLPSELAAVERDVKRYVKYVAIPVRWNGKQISKNPADVKWGYESENCRVRLTTTGGLAVYNLGVFVKEFPGYQYGRGGEVVSKQQLMLNFARNDVMVSKCPIWKEVKQFVARMAGREIAKRPNLTDDERQRLADQVRTGDLRGEEALSQKIITDVCGRHWSIGQLGSKCREVKHWTVAPRGHQLASTLHRRKAVFAIASVTLERFDLPRDPKRFRELLADLMAQTGSWHSSQSAERVAKWPYRKLSTLSEENDSRFELIDPKQWTPTEKMWLELLSYYGGYDLARRLKKERRQVLLGSGPAEAWTDGQTHIAISREWLARRSYAKLQDLVDAGHLLLHAYCHAESDQQTHVHDLEFYQNYHDLAPAVGAFAEAIFRGVAAKLKRQNRKASDKVLRSQDRLHLLDEYGPVSPRDEEEANGHSEMDVENESPS